MSRLPPTHAECVSARKCVSVIMSRSFDEALDETGFAKAIKELCKALPKVAKLSEPAYTQHAMVVALHEVHRPYPEFFTCSSP